MANDMQTGAEDAPSSSSEAVGRTALEESESLTVTRAEGQSVSAPAVRGRVAADAADAQDRIAIDLPLLGEVKLPHPHDVAFYTGVGALVALELLEWPAAVALAAGHALVSQQQHRRLREFGEALEAARCE